MRRLKAIECMTLDGVAQSPGRRDEDTSGGFAYGGWIGPYGDPVKGVIVMHYERAGETAQRLADAREGT